MGIGLIKAGVPGVLAAWVGFTLPSALIMLASPRHGRGGRRAGHRLAQGAQVMAVAWSPRRCGEWPARSARSFPPGFALVAAILVLAWPDPTGNWR
jgi:chromate transporter